MFPKPMPGMYNAQVFPRFFASNRSLGLAYLPLDKQLSCIEGKRQLFLEGSLCFILVKNISEKSKCVMLYSQSAAWFERLWTPGQFSVNVSWLLG